MHAGKPLNPVTIHKQDDGAGMYPDAGPSIRGTHCFLHMCAPMSRGMTGGLRVIVFLKSLYDSGSGLFKSEADAEPLVEAAHYAYELLVRLRNAGPGRTRPAPRPARPGAGPRPPPRRGSGRRVWFWP